MRFDKRQDGKGLKRPKCDKVSILTHFLLMLNYHLIRGILLGWPCVFAESFREPPIGSLTNVGSKAVASANNAFGALFRNAFTRFLIDISWCNELTSSNLSIAGLLGAVGFMLTTEMDRILTCVRRGPSQKSNFRWLTATWPWNPSVLDTAMPQECSLVHLQRKCVWKVSYRALASS